MTKEEMERAKSTENDKAMALSLSMDIAIDTENGDDWLAVKRTTSNDSPSKSPTLAARRINDDNYYRGLSEGLEKNGGESKEEVPDPYELDTVIATSTEFVAPSSPASSPASTTSHDKFLNIRTLHHHQTVSNRMYYQDDIDEANRLHDIHLRTTVNLLDSIKSATRLQQLQRSRDRPQ